MDLQNVYSAVKFTSAESQKEFNTYGVFAGFWLRDENIKNTILTCICPTQKMFVFQIRLWKSVLL